VKQAAQGGRATLEYLERSNLFVVPLDNRHWYRYHHLFADLLHSRFEQASAAGSAESRKSQPMVRGRHSSAKPSSALMAKDHGELPCCWINLPGQAS
jgi:LuxR family maltose regulon positive regulatory protein